MRVAPSVTISDEERRRLLAWSRGRSTPNRLVLRSRIVLRAADGLQNREIVDELHVRPETVALWRNRFITHRLDGIMKDAPRPGRRPRIFSAETDRCRHGPHAPHKTSRCDSLD